MRCKACNSAHNVTKAYDDYYCGQCRQSISDTIYEDRSIHELHKEDRVREYPLDTTKKATLSEGGEDETSR